MIMNHSELSITWSGGPYDVLHAYNRLPGEGKIGNFRNQKPIITLYQFFLDMILGLLVIDKGERLSD